jgi:hypothetical protein
VIEVVEFETTDPALRGEMTITIALTDAEGGTGETDHVAAVDVSEVNRRSSAVRSMLFENAAWDEDHGLRSIELSYLFGVHRSQVVNSSFA